MDIDSRHLSTRARVSKACGLPLTLGRLTWAGSEAGLVCVHLQLTGIAIKVIALLTLISISCQK